MVEEAVIYKVSVLYHQMDRDASTKEGDNNE